MGAFTAFGAGFFNQAAKIQDENRNEARENRRRAMDHWLQYDRPKLLAAQEEDNTTLSYMREGMSALGDNLRATHYAYLRKNGTVKTLQQYNEMYDAAKLPAIPDEMRAQFNASMDKMVDWEVGENGTIAGVRGFKPQTQEQLPVVKPSLSGILARSITGKESQTETLAGANRDLRTAGYDTSGSMFPRDLSAALPAGLGLTPVSPKKEADLDQKYTLLVQQMDRAKEPDKARALLSDKEAYVKFMTTPGNVKTEQEIKDTEVADARAFAMAQAAVQLVAPENQAKAMGMLAAAVKDKSVNKPDFVDKMLTALGGTTEQNAINKAKIEYRTTAAYPVGGAQLSMVLNDKQARKIYADTRGLSDEAARAELDAALVDANRVNHLNAAFAAAAAKGEGETPAPVLPPSSVPGGENDVNNAFTPRVIDPDTGKYVPADQLKNTQPAKKPEVRSGEIEGPQGPMPLYSKQVHEAVSTGNTEVLKRANPFAVLGRLTGKDGSEPVKATDTKTILKSLRFTSQDRANIATDPAFSSYMDSLEDLLFGSGDTPFETFEAGIASTEPGEVFLYKNPADQVGVAINPKVRK